MIARGVSAAVLALVAGLPTTSVAADRWTETTSPHFKVVSDGGAKRAEAIAWEFEQVRAVTARLWLTGA